MEEILNNQYYSALVVLISQIVFIYLRTINVIYTAEKKVMPAIISGAGIGIAWLISMSIGIESVMKGEVLPIIAFIGGGALGTYWGIKLKPKKRSNCDENDDDGLHL